jgi:ketosteroid isomerase-like protein
MRYALLAVVISSTLACGGPAAPSEPSEPPAPAEPAFDPAEIIALEQGALDRWGKGDPSGYFEIMAPDISYFDPTTKTRIDGLDALKKMIEPFRGKIAIDRPELINPTVRRDGNLAVLTTNLVSRGGSFDGGPKRDVPWNITEVYARIDGQWKIVHSHFSYTTPVVAQPGA